LNFEKSRLGLEVWRFPDIAQLSAMVGAPCGLCRRRAKGTVNPAEVERCHKQGHGMAQVFKFICITEALRVNQRVKVRTERFVRSRWHTMEDRGLKIA
jgi:hypothetical protein